MDELKEEVENRKMVKKKFHARKVRPDDVR